MANDYRNTIACVAGIVLLLVASQAHTQDLRRINYGTTTSSAHLPVWVAKDAGLFSKAGLNVEPVQIRGGALITMAIISGNLQFSGAGAESVVAARIEGGDVVLLACPVDSDPVYLITRPEIKSAAELGAEYRRRACYRRILPRAAAPGHLDRREMIILQLEPAAKR
jgi:ABC-type nitrate/sulfonate/bicarbonate transport system substrate-binding protein